MKGNTILITGAGSGIGLALAVEFAKLDNEVIIAARSLEKLKVVENKGFKTISADMSDSASIQALAKKVTKDFPKTNVIIHNAGICKLENFVRGGNSKVQDETVATNFL